MRLESLIVGPYLADTGQRVEFHGLPLKKTREIWCEWMPGGEAMIIHDWLLSALAISCLIGGGFAGYLMGYNDGRSSRRRR